jgi:S1-C subfamily serine protease
VLGVDPGSTAARIGLQPGDVILALNGCPLSHEHAWQEAMARAVGSDGKLTVRIRQGRTGRIAHRTCRLFSPAAVPAG